MPKKKSPSNHRGARIVAKSINTLAGMLAVGGTPAISMENYVVTAAQMALSSTARYCV
jgi:hypothetical protein